MAATDPAHTETTTPARPGARAGADHQLPAGADHQLPGTRRSEIGGLLRSLATDTSTLVRQEIRLAKLEAGRAARRLAVNSAWIAAGAGILIVGGLCLVIALALGLGALLGSYWLGTLITGLLLVLIGMGVAWKGARDLRESELAPKDTVASLREDADWAREEVRDLKRTLKEE